jgi:hypothetical protein
MKRRIKGLFLNTAKAKCSIYESGKMSYSCLVLSNAYSLDYQEIDEHNREIAGNYDFYIFNYHQTTMGWLNLNFVKNLPGFKSSIILEVDINNPFCLCPDNIFDAYLVLDPTIIPFKKNIYVFPRPLENQQQIRSELLIESKVPIIGSFGFYGEGKGFDKLIEAVNKEFDEAIIKINTLNPDWGGDAKIFNDFVDYLKKYPTKKNVKVIVTSEYFSKKDLINWCAGNTLNAFFYNRHSQGLSATTDQAIASGRPLAVSTCFTFRHIHQYIKPYPFVSLKESIINGSSAVNKIQEAWSGNNFAKKFENVLEENFIYENKPATYVKIVLPKVKNSTIKFLLFNFINPNIVILLSNIKNVIFKNVKRPVDNRFSICPTPFIHPAIHSYSYLQEDLLVDFLLGQKETGFYINIGADDPISPNNTNRFYQRGWRGSNILLNSEILLKFKKYRSLDINLIAKNEDFNIINDLLPKILENNLNCSKIDLISLDTSKDALLILKNINWNLYRSSIVIIKCDYSFELIRFFMENNDYLNIYKNSINAFFVDKFTKDSNLLKLIQWETIQ